MTAISSNPETDAAQRAIDKHRGRFVPWIIAAFYLTFMSALIGFVFIAYAHPPSEVTSEAYEKGLAYNDILARSDAQKALGWASTTTYDQGQLTFSLTDKQKAAIRQAQVRVWFVHPNDATKDRHFDLQPTAAGEYRVAAPLPEAGLWTVHVTAQSAGHEYQSATQIEVR